MRGPTASMFAVVEVTRGHEPTEPPPPRPLVQRAPRAGVRAPDQRFLVLRPVGDAGFSGVFLGACSACPVQAYARPTQGVRFAIWPMSCGFVPDGGSPAPTEVVLRVHAQGMRMHCLDQGEISTGPRAKNFVGAQPRVGRPGSSCHAVPPAPCCRTSKHLVPARRTEIAGRAFCRTAREPRTVGLGLDDWTLVRQVRSASTVTVNRGCRKLDSGAELARRDGKRSTSYLR